MDESLAVSDSYE